jgi:acyl-CoA hydrolase
MPSVQDQYRHKLQSATEALRQVRDGDFIVVPTGVAEPPALLAALSEQRRSFRDVKVAQILPSASSATSIPRRSSM